MCTCRSHKFSQSSAICELLDEGFHDSQISLARLNEHFFTFLFLCRWSPFSSFFHLIFPRNFEAFESEFNGHDRPTNEMKLVNLLTISCSNEAKSFSRYFPTIKDILWLISSWNSTQHPPTWSNSKEFTAFVIKSGWWKFIFKLSLSPNNVHFSMMRRSTTAAHKSQRQ